VSSAIWNIATVQSLVDTQVQEARQLEYKAARAVEDSISISIDVSAFANSGGGTIIYGVREFDERDKRHLPEGLDPIDSRRCSKERLEQIINSNVQPKIEGILITPVIAGGPFGVLYVIEVPQSNTAHQAADKRYYRRYNFQNLKMDDNEIRDVMNRLKDPKVSFLIRIERRSADVFVIRPVLVNEGVILAKHIRSIYDIPSSFINPGWHTQGQTVLLTPGDPNSAVIRYDSRNKESGVLHPGLETQLAGLILSDEASRDLRRNNPLPFESEGSLIRWSVSADNARMNQGTLNLRSLWPIDWRMM
jgi:hypothetical protein